MTTTKQDEFITALQALHAKNHLQVDADIAAQF